MAIWGRESNHRDAELGDEQMRDPEGREEVRMGAQSEIPREEEAPRSSELRSIPACTSEGSALAPGLRMGCGSSERKWGPAGSLAATRREAPGSASLRVRGWTAYPGLWSGYAGAVRCSFPTQGGAWESGDGGQRHKGVCMCVPTRRPQGHGGGSWRVQSKVQARDIWTRSAPGGAYSCGW